MKSLFLAVAFVLISGSVQISSAQSFDPMDFGIQSFETARAVFIGEVSKVEPFTGNRSDFPSYARLVKVTFNVEYSWKGAGFREFGLRELVVLSALTSEVGYSTSWGTFVEGNKYLVYADETKDKQLVVWTRSLTKPLWRASEDLKELKRMDVLFPRARYRDFN